jgi:hypothetical protein
MKTYLNISNPGEASSSAFRIMGDSTARGTDQIGQFGSGAKHAILVLLRHKIQFSIFAGLRKIPVNIVEEQHGDRKIPVVYIDNLPTSMSLEFGAIDWTDPAMALRELICNALDQGALIGDAVQFTTAEIVPTAGITQVQIEANIGGPVWAAASELDKMFLHYKSLENTSILPKEKMSPLKFYRKGVFVSESPIETLFDYNDTKGQVKIDESRQFSGFNLSAMMVSCVNQADYPQQDQWLLKIHSEVLSEYKQSPYEFSISYYSFHYGDYARSKAKEIAEELYDCKAGSVEAYNEAIKDGLKPLLAKYEIFESLFGCDLKVASQILQSRERTVTPCELSIAWKRVFNNAWNQLELKSLTNGKTKPSIHCFTHTGKELLMGFVDEEGIHLNIDQVSTATAVEEIIHYCYGVSDYSRAFQEISMKMLSAFIND